MLGVLGHWSGLRGAGGCATPAGSSSLVSRGLVVPSLVSLGSAFGFGLGGAAALAGGSLLADGGTGRWKRARRMAGVPVGGSAPRADGIFVKSGGFEPGTPSPNTCFCSAPACL